MATAALEMARDPRILPSARKYKLKQLRIAYFELL
jgi:hypothetical protein